MWRSVYKTTSSPGKVNSQTVNEKQRSASHRVSLEILFWSSVCVCVCVCVCPVAQSCPTLLHPRDCSLPGPSVHGIKSFHFSSKGSSWPRDQTQVSCISSTGRQTLYPWAIWKALSEALQYKHSHENCNPWWRVNRRVDWDRSCTYWTVLFTENIELEWAPEGYMLWTTVGYLLFLPIKRQNESNMK